MSAPAPPPKPWSISPTDVLAALETDAEHGLEASEASQRLAECGPNELEERAGTHPLTILWEQFTSVMVLILIAAAVLSAFLGKPLETIAISAIVVLFGILGFFQEYRAERAMAALKQLAMPVVRVRRGGSTVEISARDLVPGDIVMLEAGSSVPADLRLIEAANLRIQEAALTGESEPVEKDPAARSQPELALAERRNMAYMGTFVTYGRGAGVVVGTGNSTELGRIAELIQSVPRDETPLQRQLDRVGKQLGAFGVAVALLLLGVGVLAGEAFTDMVLAAVSMAVAVVPEGLPAVVTVTLALGAQRMLRRRALIRKLPAVETLGAVTTICSDKTGTLTQNRMTVTVIDVAGHFLELSGTGGPPAPSLSAQHERASMWDNQPPSVGLVLAAGALCNDASLEADSETGDHVPVGDPTEGALLVAALQAGLDKSALEEWLPRAAELPFDSERKRMTTVHELPDDRSKLPSVLASIRAAETSYIAFTKGSVDGLLDICSHVWLDDHPEPMDDTWRDRIIRANDDMAANGVRVLGVALRALDTAPEAPDESLEEGLTFVGLTGMIDPPRPEVERAIQVCKTAGIRPLMITGDHPLTARFIAEELGISSDGRVATGADLERMDEAKFEETVGEVSVYARVTPEHKLRIVEALQKRGEVVAMTGDGVNDSPALKKANIGVAMGIAGTDVSKEAAQMVLLDDNFATIVTAVEEGRAIFENIRRFVKFSLAGNVGKVFVMLFAPLLGITLALQPLQLLWLNLLTDGLLGIGLGLEPADEETMQRAPRDPQRPFLDAELRRRIAWIGLLIGVVALGTGYAAFVAEGPEDRTWQTMIFTTIAFAQIGQALAARSGDDSTSALDFRSNPTLGWMVVLTFLLQLGAIYLPFLDDFFGVVPLSLGELAITLGVGALVFVIIEAHKRLAGR
ncbi:cation-translocating P-type ATPase [Persicimonas caeni]|uniref:Cation-translocating P-type ATPase n=1 Tax=Persicimonas caeni TaxID=2292766 RepID=A0A4Y6Q0X6_PERCE|nr:cation-translocating P-type ATPase [Persicimonas caeni]QDG54089.1 cation-translocating P-type ATPase [Persicimonas caeni]QED35310.1 cation-translocating P-type ATPase [Persicimonas caeni]